MWLNIELDLRSPFTNLYDTIIENCMLDNNISND